MNSNNNKKLVRWSMDTDTKDIKCTEDYYLYETIRSSYDKDFKKLIETIKEMK
jgi:hypothetical protein